MGKSEKESSTFNDHAVKKEKGLQRSLQARHLTMMAIGGAIGTGLFVQRVSHQHCGTRRCTCSIHPGRSNGVFCHD